MKLATRTFNREDWYITSKFGKRIHPITKKESFHYGCDYGTNCQKWPQYALEKGIVTRVGYNSKGYGNYLDVQYPRLGIQLFYGHLSKVNVKKGQEVTHETQLGLTGTTGQSTGIHLHLGMKKIGGSYEDPEKYDYKEPIPITNDVERDETKDQVKVLIAKLRIRTGPSLSSEILGFGAKDKYYNYTEKIKNDGYTWFKIAEDNYIAYVKDCIEDLPHKEENIIVKIINAIIRILKSIFKK